MLKRPSWLCTATAIEASPPGRRWQSVFTGGIKTDESSTVGLAADLDLQMTDGAWVDAAVGALWSGSDDPDVSAAYAALTTKVLARRAERDAKAAGRLTQSVDNGPAALFG